MKIAGLMESEKRGQSVEGLLSSKISFDMYISLVHINTYENDIKHR
jgi:hypothetical protein